jgi:hypothetical protein
MSPEMEARNIRAQSLTFILRSEPMTRQSEQEDEHPDIDGAASTPHLDRLENLADAATTAAQAKQWRARKNGVQQQEEPSEVRNLSHNAEERARAEEAMRHLMAKPAVKRRGR